MCGSLGEWCSLLDMGFEASINGILKRLPKQRRTVRGCSRIHPRVLARVRGGGTSTVYADLRVDRAGSVLGHANDASQGAGARGPLIGSFLACISQQHVAMQGLRNPVQIDVKVESKSKPDSATGSAASSLTGQTQVIPNSCVLPCWT